jgi:hypothetical protein
VRSHQKAAAATFTDEIVPVGEFAADEHIRPDSTVEVLAGLRPIMAAPTRTATVTAGNASGQNDGAAVCVVTHPERAAELGLRPLARLVSWGLGGVPPATMGIGPVPATAKALAAAGLTLADMDLIELNEAFAAQVLAVLREWKLTDADLERVNVNGSGISLGHPVGATGGRILATLLRELDRRGARYGLETMCIGGGQGLAAVFERTGDDGGGAGHGRRGVHRVDPARPTAGAHARPVPGGEPGRRRARHLPPARAPGEDGPRRAGALADAVHSDPSTISRQIGHLVKLGYVERTADPEDGRATLLAATDEGRRVLEEKPAAAQRALQPDPGELVGRGPGRPLRDARQAHRGHRDVRGRAAPSGSSCSWLSASFARFHDALISRSASARPTQVAPSTLLPGSSAL